MGLAANLSTFAISTAQAETSAPVPHLYEVRKGEAVSWVFGTFHVGVSLEPFRKLIEPRLQKARTVYFEVEKIERSRLWVNDPILAIQTSSSMKTDGAPLLNQLKRRAIEDYQIPEVLAKDLRVDSCTLFLDSLEAKAPRLDSEIAVLAHKLRRPIANLDTDELREQADIIDAARGRSRECDVADIFMSMSLSELRAESQDLITQYNSGSTEDLRRARTGEMTGDIYRNFAWVDKLTSPLKRGHVFAAFGVAHLYGDRGVLELLKKSGFEIRRVRLDGTMDN